MLFLVKINWKFNKIIFWKVWHPTLLWPHMSHLNDPCKLNLYVFALTMQRTISRRCHFWLSLGVNKTNNRSVNCGTLSNHKSSTRFYKISPEGLHVFWSDTVAKIDGEYIVIRLSSRSACLQFWYSTPWKIIVSNSLWG